MEDFSSGETSQGWTFIGSYKWNSTEEAANEGLYTLQTGNYFRSYEGSRARPRPFRGFMKKIDANAKTLVMQFSDTPITTISKIELLNKNNRENSRIYDLNGNYLGTRHEVFNKGLYIVDGKVTPLP